MHRIRGPDWKSEGLADLKRPPVYFLQKYSYLNEIERRSRPDAGKISGVNFHRVAGLATILVRFQLPADYVL
jgi:hypothetical protein